MGLLASELFFPVDQAHCFFLPGLAFEKSHEFY
jgi:hypothetical protein